MSFPNHQQIEDYKKQYPPGTRIELESMHGEEDMYLIYRYEIVNVRVKVFVLLP